MCHGKMGVSWGWVWCGMMGVSGGWVCDSAGVTPGRSLAFRGHELSTAELGGTGLSTGQAQRCVCAGSWAKRNALSE